VRRRHGQVPGAVPGRLGTHAATVRTGESLLDIWWRASGWHATELVMAPPSGEGGRPTRAKKAGVEGGAAPSDQARLFVELLDEVCIKARLTREQVGQLLGVKRRTVQSWVSGQRVPRPEVHETLDRLHTVVQPVFGWTVAAVQRWMHTGEPSGFDLLLQGDYTAFRERVAEATSRRRVIVADVRHVSGPRVRTVGDEDSVEEVALAPKDLLNDWLRDVRRHTEAPRRRSSNWSPEGYEWASGLEQD